MVASKESLNPIFFSRKAPILHPTCATFSQLPSWCWRLTAAAVDLKAFYRVAIKDLLVDGGAVRVARTWSEIGPGWRKNQTMVLILDGDSEIEAHVRLPLCYLICLRHLIRSGGATIQKYLVSFMRAQHVRSYLLIYVPWFRRTDCWRCQRMPWTDKITNFCPSRAHCSMSYRLLAVPWYRARNNIKKLINYWSGLKNVPIRNAKMLPSGQGYFFYIYHKFLLYIIYIWYKVFDI